jgi:hypothetical protein
MEFNKIATLLNNTLVPNVFGEGQEEGERITIAEDLSNVVDLGIALEDLDADTLKNYSKTLAVGVFDTWCDTRKYKDETYDLFMSEIEWGGAVQRVKAKLMSASDTPILTLVNAKDNGPDYNDGKYYGAEWDSRIYSKDSGFMVKYSIPVEEFKKSFTSAAGVAKLIAMIEATVDNTLRVELNTLARGVLRKLVVNAYEGNRYIPLITLYNTLNGYVSGDSEYVTLSNWKRNITFKLWVQTVCLELRKYMTDINNKYNNGSVECFSPEDETRAVLLTEFATELDVALGSVYHKEMVDGVGSYRSINYWQNGTKDLLPQIGTSLHDEIKETDGETVVTIDHVVGVFYDKYSAFITNKLDKTTVAYIAQGDFNTYFHHVVKSYAIDPRNTAVALVLS